MKIVINEDALQWFANEMGVQPGQHVRFYVRYGGSSPVQQGFSLGVTIEEPIDIGSQTQYNGATYFIEDRDLWYFDGHDLIVNYNSTLDEPEYNYVKPD
ncbi:MAG TPA: HesB/YadR/YfhF family protein [Chondromyces sp.]|nr:HesB/YadR/YfhF family protein [Chondromyces sp.]